MRLKSRVLVTGAAGFLGQAVCRCLNEHGYAVYRYSLTSRQYQTELVGEPVYSESFAKEAIVQVLRKTRPDFVVHLASAGVLEGDSSPATLYDINVVATKNIVEAVAEVGGCKIIHTGTCSEYACQEDKLIVEASPLGAPNYYGATKAASVQIFIGLSRQLGVPAVVLRPFNIYGPGESLKRLIPYLIQQQLSGLECQLTHGWQQKDFLFVDDAARGFLAAIQRFEDLEQHEIYNLCSGIPTNLRFIGERIVRLMRGDSRLFRWGAKPSRPGEPRFIVGDPSRLVAATGWEPTTDLDLGLGKAILYYRQQHSNSIAPSTHPISAAAA